MTRMTGPDCVVMCNLINTYIHTYIHTYKHTYQYIQHTHIHTYICTSKESVSPLSRLIKGFRNKYRVALNDSDDRTGNRGYVQFNKYTYIH